MQAQAPVKMLLPTDSIKIVPAAAPPPPAKPKEAANNGAQARGPPCAQGG